MKNKKEIEDWSFTNTNYILFLLGILTIFFGYILMYKGDAISAQSVKVAPIILVIGYCIIIPLSLLYKK